MPAFWEKIARYGNLLLIVSLIVLAGAYFLCNDRLSYYASVFGFLLISIGYGLMVMGAISPKSFLYKWKSRVTTFIATLSYALYLLHKGVIHIVHLLLKEYSLYNSLVLLISILACIVVAYVVNIIIERPFTKLGRKIAARIGG
jgi:peptidoglycan/LPS O-acetylase OafA/YrhL